jgi:hypothetical protein
MPARKNNDPERYAFKVQILLTEEERIGLDWLAARKKQTLSEIFRGLLNSEVAEQERQVHAARRQP